MSRIESKFQSLKSEGRKALITFVTAGDPQLEVTKKLVREMECCGADIIELGIPYSDPIAEGPVIQRANERALRNQIKVKDVFALVRELRNETQIPIVFLLYFNCILQYGAGRFFQNCAEAGVDGVIIPDLPFEEADEIRPVAKDCGVDIISLVSPTSRERVKQIAENASGFLYCVSSLGVTGVRNDFTTDFVDFFSHINEHSPIPTAIGFGISTPEHILQLRKYSDGLIIGSAIVKKVEESNNENEIVKNVGELIKDLRMALDR